jgi:hypothetical protein
MRLIAALAPSIVWLAALFFLGLILICFPKVFAGFPIRSLILAILDWSILPALALLAGAAPFLWTRLQQA